MIPFDMLTIEEASALLDNALDDAHRRALCLQLTKHATPAVRALAEQVHAPIMLRVELRTSTTHSSRAALPELDLELVEESDWLPGQGIIRLMSDPERWAPLGYPLHHIKKVDLRAGEASLTALSQRWRGQVDGLATLNATIIKDAPRGEARALVTLEPASAAALAQRVGGCAELGGPITAQGGLIEVCVAGEETAGRAPLDRLWARLIAWERILAQLDHERALWDARGQDAPR